MISIRKSADAYEKWLADQLDGGIVRRDLELKYKKMGDTSPSKNGKATNGKANKEIKSNPFVFLRATYWRWAETILQHCSELADAPNILSVGDVHLENFGVWRDRENRLVWGVNDFDEAAKMPYVLDLVRLAASAILATPDGRHPPEKICAHILDGYRKNLLSPVPIVLEKENAWLRHWIETEVENRGKFWNELIEEAEEQLSKSPDPPRTRYKKALRKALPGADCVPTFEPRQAGVGSLGRPRWVAIAEWEGGPVVREAKALVASAWDRAVKKKKLKSHAERLAFSRYQPADPWLDFKNGVVVRRLAPNSRKLDLDGKEKKGVPLNLLEEMGRAIANIHAASPKHVPRILDDLDKRSADWLLKAAKRAAEATKADYKAWVESSKGAPKPPSKAKAKAKPKRKRTSVVPSPLPPPVQPTASVPAAL